MGLTQIPWSRSTTPARCDRRCREPETWVTWTCWSGKTRVGAKARNIPYLGLSLLVSTYISWIVAWWIVCNCGRSSEPLTKWKKVWPCLRACALYWITCWLYTSRFRHVNISILLRYVFFCCVGLRKAWASGDFGMCLICCDPFILGQVVLLKSYRALDLIVTFKPHAATAKLFLNALVGPSSVNDSIFFRFNVASPWVWGGGRGGLGVGVKWKITHTSAWIDHGWSKLLFRFV